MNELGYAVFAVVVFVGGLFFVIAIGGLIASVFGSVPRERD